MALHIAVRQISKGTALKTIVAHGG